MYRYALVTLYRSLTRHRLYAALNVGGLALGIAVFLVLALYVRFETSFETWWPRYGSVYVVETVWNLPESPVNGAYPETMGGLLEELRADFPGVVGTRIRGGEGGGSVLQGGRATREDVAQVDPSFPDVFAVTMRRGDARAALSRPDGALISERVARRYFGSADPIGRPLTISIDMTGSYRVAGVFRDLPANSDLKLGVLVALPRAAPASNWYHWGSTALQTYLRFDTPAAAQAFSAKLEAFTNRRGRELAEPGKPAWQTQQLRLLPLARLHLEPQGPASGGRKVTVTTLGLIGTLTLLIASVNYVNLATARAGLRAREVAMRKVLGADRAALIGQFLGEAVLTVAVAALLGLILAELGLPFVNAAGGTSLTIAYAPMIPALVLLSLVIGVAAGLYPAVLLARVPAAAVLAAARAPGGGRAGSRTRAALVAAQFALAITFAIGTAVLMAQTRHMRQADLGFRRESIVVVRATADDTLRPAQRRAVIAALAAVRGITVANDAPGGSGLANSDNVPLPGVAGSGPSLRWVIVGPRFFETYGAKLIAGRLFDAARASDDAQTRDPGQPSAIVINRRALAALRFGSPEAAIGRTVGGDRPRTIIGVVEDLRFASPREPQAPTYYVFYRDAAAFSAAVAGLRVAGDPRAALAAVRATWQRMVPQVPFDGDTADRRLAGFYAADERATRLFVIGAGLSILIGCVGLWGLAFFTTARRVREIGIRKTLGASATDIVCLLIAQFLRPVLLANLIAWPLAYVALRRWLAGFDDRIALSPAYFVAASGAAALVAMLTVLGQSVRASRAAPAWALRHD
ncbi:ABC transporter permease [Sphingomonas sp. BK345]|uniref:ABC transporter permease n=1 Tax=Sphingomonas sp. BK345 TaxID=2586980 RepID=UPI0016093D24|nr:ABC transporter permease [Sphingomonas sp. BK345]MBB3475424.1 putative ABC transport system permease protein [Sphingomonas sp. BK345]